MRIRFAPFINHVVKLAAVEPPNLEGQVVVRGHVETKDASLTLELAEAVRIFREMKKMDIEGIAKAYGIK